MEAGLGYTVRSTLTKKQRETRKVKKHNCLLLTIEKNLRCTTWDFMNMVKLLTDTEDIGVHTQLF